MVRINIAAKVKFRIIQSMFIFMMDAVFRNTATIIEMIVIAAIKNAVAIIKGISPANVTIKCILSPSLIHFRCEQQVYV